MSRRLKRTAVVIVAIFALAQLIRPERANPLTNVSRTIQAQVDGLVSVLDRVVIVTRPDTTEEIVHQCTDAEVRRVWMHQSLAKGSSVSTSAVEYCRQHDISVIPGACPMMFGPGVDVGHKCMRWMMKLTGGLPV